MSDLMLRQAQHKDLSPRRESVWDFLLEVKTCRDLKTLQD